MVGSSSDKYIRSWNSRVMPNKEIYNELRIVANENYDGTAGRHGMCREIKSII